MKMPMDLTEVKLRRKDVFEGKIMTVHVDDVRLPNGEEATREVVDHVDGAAVLALDEANRVLVVRQYRYVFGKVLDELPAGKLDPGEDPVTGALRELKEETGAKVRGIELNLLQRCGAHLASETDIEESFMAGKAAVENAVNGINGRMIGFERGVRDGRYACKTKLIPLMEVANVEKKIPREWINAEGNGVNHQFIEYALPLIQGEPDLPKVDSLPRFAKLKKILAK